MQPSGDACKEESPSPPYALEGEILDEEVKLDYNECEGIIVPKIIEEHQRIKAAKHIRKILQEKGEDQVERQGQLDQLDLNALLFLTRQGQCIEIHGATIEEGEQTGHEDPRWTSLGILFIKEKGMSDTFMKKGNPIISLIDLAIIPLKKKMKEEEEKDAKARKREGGGVDQFKKEKGVATTEVRVEIDGGGRGATQTKL